LTKKEDKNKKTADKPAKNEKKQGPQPGTKFKKGNPGGPGRPKNSVEIRKAAKLGKEMFQGIFHKFSLMEYEEFLEFFKAGKMNVMERIVSGVMVKAMKGDTSSASLIWDRMMGRITETVEITLPKPMVIERPSGAQIVLGHEDANTIDVLVED